MKNVDVPVTKMSIGGGSGDNKIHISPSGLGLFPVGFLKLRVQALQDGNKLIVDGEDYHGHQDHPPEPSGNGSAGHSE